MEFLELGSTIEVKVSQGRLKIAEKNDKSSERYYNKNYPNTGIEIKTKQRDIWDFEWKQIIQSGRDYLQTTYLINT